MDSAVNRKGMGISLTYWILVLLFIVLGGAAIYFALKNFA